MAERSPVLKYLAGKYPQVHAVRFTNSVEKQDFFAGDQLLFARFIPEYPCSVREKLAGMSEEEFWDDVFAQGVYIEPYPFDENGEIEKCFGIDAPTPCPECGSTVACGYDSEGRPMIHVAQEDIWGREDNG